ncbi:MAG: hypothetical protein II359_06370 [Clostridia bacterium]|nr:hypothetical protein [Clostridia bacterium]
MATFTNQAFLTYNGETVNSNVVTGEVVGVLSAEKTAVSGTYTQGDTITYVVSIINTGTTAITGLTVTDDLGAYTFGSQTLVPLTYVEGSVKYYINGVLEPAPAVTTTSPLTVVGLSVPAGGDAILIYEAQVNNYAPLGTQATIDNTATLNYPQLTTVVTATESVIPEDGAQLSITKSVSPTTVNENGELVYTLVISNLGATPVIATDDAIVSDTFEPILNNINVTYNGTAWTEGTNYTYDSVTGLFTTNPGEIAVPAATYSQNPVTGEWETIPGTTVIQITGTV